MWVVMTVVILSSSVISAQDVHDTAAPRQSNSDAEKQQHQPESADDLFDDSIDDAIDEDTDEEDTLESTQIETLADVREEMDPVVSEDEATDHEPSSMYHEPSSESKETAPAPADEQQVTSFPPAFDQAAMDSSNVAQVTSSVALIVVDLFLRDVTSKHFNVSY